jgi:iron complex transport system substrate-binding protein
VGSNRSEWWIGRRRSITDDGRSQEVLSLSTETVIDADPDSIIVFDLRQIEALKSDAPLSQLPAVREGKILVVRIGAHTWDDRTVEQRLTGLWAATQFHPELFPDSDLAEEVRSFYQTFDLTDEQVGEILSGSI